MNRSINDSHPGKERRAFLRMAAAPVGSLLLGACGGGAGPGLIKDALAGQADDAATTLAAESPSGPPPSTAAAPMVVVDRGASPAVAPPPSGPVPDWVANLPLWQWHEIPNTSLASVEPAVRPLGIMGPRAKIDAWCGATLKREGSVYMLGAAGGHGDYAGNEVDALALNVATPGWVQLRGPTPNDQIINGTQFYLDDRPSATHTYYATQFIDELNRMVVFASPGIYGPFPAAPPDFPYVDAIRSFSFDVATGDWDGPNYIAQFPGRGDFTACLCVKHPWTGDVYYSRNYGDGWYRWTRVSNTWSRLSGETRAPWYAGTAIDPRRNQLLAVGGYSAAAPEIRSLDGSRVSALFTGQGAKALTLSRYPGVVYDEANDCYLVLYNAGGSIKALRVHPETWLVEEPAIMGSAPTARANGVQNSVQYVPELRGFAIANNYDLNVKFVRTHA